MTSDSRQRWMALWAAMLGFLLDAMDVLLYVFAIPALRAEFGWTNAQAGLVGSATMLASSAGGILAGVLSDRYGRRRILIYTILLYSFASAGTATSTGFASLLFWRVAVGLGLGGEWAAGATLVAESWPSGTRGRAIAFMQSGWALGYILAAAVAGLVLPVFGWRTLFLIGVAPAVLTIFIRRNVSEPTVWRASAVRADPSQIFRRPLLRLTVLACALATSTQFAYWGMFTWLPGFLSASREQGGAGLSIVQTSAWVIVMQLGAFCGYNSFGYLADRLGRRPAFLIFVGMAALLVPAYGYSPRWASSLTLLALGPLIGFFGSGYFSLFGAMLAELFPTPVRCTAQGFTYNLGRGIAALAPYLVGAVADRHGFEAAITMNAGFFLLAGLFILMLPETRNADISSSVAKVTVT